MIKKLLAVIWVAFVMASCSTVRHTSDTVEVSNTVKTFTVADLDVSPQKVSMTTSWGYNPFVPVSVERVKKNTEAKLVDANGADVLIEPQYIIEKRGFLRGGSVTVIGFPAKYKNFHKMTPEEAELLKELSVKEKTQKKRFFFF